MNILRERRSKLFCLLCVVAIGLALFVHNSRSAAQIGGAAVWHDINPATLLPNAGARIIQPRRYRTLALDTVGLRTILARAPMEFTAAARGRAGRGDFA